MRIIVLLGFLALILIALFQDTPNIYNKIDEAVQHLLSEILNEEIRDLFFAILNENEELPFSMKHYEEEKYFSLLKERISKNRKTKNEIIKSIRQFSRELQKEQEIWWRFYPLVKDNDRIWKTSNHKSHNEDQYYIYFNFDEFFKRLIQKDMIDEGDEKYLKLIEEIDKELFDMVNGNSNKFNLDSKESQQGEETEQKRDRKFSFLLREYCKPLIHHLDNSHYYNLFYIDKKYRDLEIFTKRHSSLYNAFLPNKIYMSLFDDSLKTSEKYNDVQTTTKEIHQQETSCGKILEFYESGSGATVFDYFDYKTSFNKSNT